MLLVLVRHARSSANADGVLAGRLDGVHLDDEGRAQAEALVSKFSGVQVTQILGSPMVRCRETAEALCIEKRVGYTVTEALTEVDYGLWSGRKLDDLSKEPLWSDIQERPTSVTFPEGESMAGLFARTKTFLELMRDFDENAVVLAFSHGDVIKALLANAYAMEPDHFQRIVVDPASISVVRIAGEKIFVQRVNESATTLEKMLAKKSSDATVGGEVK